jgi:hypothetical protein
MSRLQVPHLVPVNLSVQFSLPTDHLTQEFFHFNLTFYKAYTPSLTGG